MAILGVFTNIGVTKAIEAQNNEGFKIYPTSFGVSRTRGTIDPSRTTPNGGQWFTGPISSRVVIDQNTVKFICTIPANSIPPNTTDFVREIYLYGLDTNNVDFMIALGQPSSDLLYDPSGSLTLELEISLTNVDLSSTVVFSYTQATELSEHNLDPNAHPDFVREFNRAGMFIDAGNTPFSYAGQSYDKKARFDGVLASGVYSGVVFTATWEGPLGNTITLPFDGIKTTDDVRAIWNAANPNNTVEHNDNTGALILPAGTLTLGGGTLAVSDKDLVYKDVDGKYKRARGIAGIQGKVAGLAYVNDRIVKSLGFHTFTHSFPVGTDLYLDTSVLNAGKVTSNPTPVKIGFAHSTTTIFLGPQGGGASGGGSSAGYDAVVTDIAGVGFYPTTQEAVDNTPNGGRILVDKLEEVEATIDTQNKRIDFYFTGREAGWTRYQGTAEVQRITFSSVPTSGTWRLEFPWGEVGDLAYNANAAAIQAAINAFAPQAGLPVVVTGDYTVGFDITYASFVNVLQPTLNNPGVNEIQTITFDAIPDDGTVRFNYAGQDTPNFAWNDDATTLETYLEAPPALSNVQVSGNYAIGFQVEFVGVDGKQNHPQLTVTNNTLLIGVVPVNPTITTTVQGKFPANNLKVGANPVAVTVATLVGGTPIGATTAIDVTADGTRFLDGGLIQNFPVGIDFNNHTQIDVDMVFQSVVTPYVVGTLRQNKDYNLVESWGLPKSRDITVGVYGDYPTLWAAVAAANTGDRIYVHEDQSITTNQVIDKDIEIVFLNKARCVVTTLFTGAALALGNRVRTKYLVLEYGLNGAFDTAIELFGKRGHHQDLNLVLGGISTTLTNAFVIALNASGIYCDGVISRALATVTNGLVNNSATSGHNVIIRDEEGGLIYDVQEKQAFIQEEPTGAVDGLNNTFTLSQTVGNAQALFVFVDGLIQTRGLAWGLGIVPNTIVFNPGFLPAPSQKVWVGYFPSGIIKTPSRQLAVYNQTVQAQAGVVTIRLGPSLVATPSGANEVTIDTASGTSAWQVYTYTISALDISNKFFDLTPQPQAPSKVLVDFYAYGPKEFGVDYSISPAGRLSWNALGLDGLVVAGDKVRVAYYG